jgi:putative hydrolase of the HAD superfamily
MLHVKAICLDLDDTLWDLAPVLRRAEQSIYEWFALRYPRITQRYLPEDISALRSRMLAESPGYEHDLARLRRATFARLARETGYPESVADEAFAAFQHLRNQVILFEDVRPGLERLSRRAPLVALTNGNADLDVIGLRSFFTAVLTAGNLAAAKPDPRVFLAVCARLDLAPAFVLHAGDHPEKDVAAARAVGMSAIWVDRGLHEWPESLAPADHVVRDLHQLALLVGA